MKKREYFSIYKYFSTLYEENFGTFYQHRNIALINGERIPEISLWQIFDEHITRERIHVYPKLNGEEKRVDGNFDALDTCDHTRKRNSSLVNLRNFQYTRAPVGQIPGGLAKLSSLAVDASLISLVYHLPPSSALLYRSALAKREIVFSHRRFSSNGARNFRRELDFNADNLLMNKISMNKIFNFSFWTK